MTEQEIKDLVEKGHGGGLTPQEQTTLAHECWVYRRMAIRLEASVHDLVKKVEAQEIENDLLDDECTKRQLRILSLEKAVARDAEIRRECAERAEEWRVNLGPGDDEASTLRAAIIGEEVE